MQPDHEADELEALLHEGYGAPPLDDQFSADLIARLQAEEAPPSVARSSVARSSAALSSGALSSAALSSRPTRPRRSPLTVCVGLATVAALVIAVIWISRPGTPGTNREVAQQAKTDAGRSALRVESEIPESLNNDRARHLSVSPRSMSLSKSLSAGNESESKNYSESRLQRESLATEDRKPRKLSKLSALELSSEEWLNLSATAALADMLYVVDSGHLYEVNASDGSRRSVGEADWRNTAAMGSFVGHLYLVCDNQLYEVNPKTAARRSLGKPNWVNTKAIVTAGGKLYIASNGLLHRVNPSDGSHEVLHITNDISNNARQPKP